MKISLEDAHAQLSKSAAPFTEVFAHGSLSVELYKPAGVDLQQPHDRDEVYVIASGNGVFFCDGQRVPFSKGDFLFVKAGIEHRFEDFSEDFTTWVLFYGPVGGEVG